MWDVRSVGRTAMGKLYALSPLYELPVHHHLLSLLQSVPGFLTLCPWIDRLLLFSCFSCSMVCHDVLDQSFSHCYLLFLHQILPLVHVVDFPLKEKGRQRKGSLNGEIKAVLRCQTNIYLIC